MSARRCWVFTFLTTLPVYLLTAHYKGQSIDTVAAVVPAWQLVHHHNLWLEGFAHPPHWSVWVGHHLVSNRMGGVILAAVPVYAVLWLLPLSATPGAITAALLAAAAIATLHLVLRRLVSARTAAVGTVVLALGTSFWTIVSAEVWTHTVDALALALALLALARDRYLSAGLAISIAIPARPHVAIIAAVVGLYLGASVRSWRPTALVAAGCLPGLALLLTWNRIVFHRFDLNGGYGGVSQRVAGGSSGLAGHLLSYGQNFAGFLLSPYCGLLVYLPLALVSFVGARQGWRASPPWARAMLLGAIAYSLAQLWINGFTGGYSFYGYRLATELVVCAAPFTAVVCTTWARQSSRRVRLVAVLGTLSIGIQAMGALVGNIASEGNDAHPWQTSKIWLAFLNSPPIGLLVLLVTAATCLVLIRPPAREELPTLERLLAFARRGGRGVAGSSGSGPQLNVVTAVAEAYSVSPE